MLYKSPSHAAVVIVQAATVEDCDKYGGIIVASADDNTRRALGYSDKGDQGGVTTTTQAAPNYDAKIYSDPKFDFFYICDCGDIPGFENRWFPHWNIKNDEDYTEHNHSRVTADRLSQQQVDHMISIATKYLKSKGIMPCEKYIAEALSDPESAISAFSLDVLKPIAPPDKKASKNKTLLSFEWKYSNDPAKMRMAITSIEGDVPKYASILQTLSLKQVQSSDAAVLERSMWPKKGPMVLRRFLAMDVHLLDPAAIEDLKKISLRINFEDLTVAGSVLGKRSVPDLKVEAEALLETSKRAGI
ncbi:hypothetical protein BGX30_004525 [Mortierella sp. GBA39]|nr:hypothetical protein BGX30_004525 [Mortierella sp. GBA39]